MGDRNSRSYVMGDHFSLLVIGLHIPVATSKARNRLLDELTQECHRYIAAELLPALTEKIANELRTESGWSFDVDPRDRGVLLFEYPRSENQDWASAEYLRPVVRLELGAKSDHWPASDQVLRS